MGEILHFRGRKPVEVSRTPVENISLRRELAARMITERHIIPMDVETGAILAQHPLIHFPVHRTRPPNPEDLIA